MEKDSKPKPQKISTPPIINYTNAIIKLNYSVAILLANRRIPVRDYYDPLIVVILNLPPKGTDYFEKDLVSLTELNLNKKQIWKLYRKLNNWIYVNLYEIAFKIRGYSNTEQINFEEIELKID